jgi:hypothetical protein
VAAKLETENMGNALRAEFRRDLLRQTFALLAVYATTTTVLVTALR